ncbi:MAG: T9SS type A sorting domain-containing protein, partial [Bacteroidia bacterium]
KTYGNYGQDVQEYIFDMKPTADGGYIMCGAPNYANNTQAWVIKTDSLGIAPGMIDVVVNELGMNDQELKIYPNPTSGILNLKIKDVTDLENYKLKITNLIGQTILEIKTEKQINIKELKGGIYFLQLYQKEKLIATKKIIKE